MEGYDISLLEAVNFNLEIAPNRTNLMSMEKGNQESVRTYAQRWRICVQTPLIETEMVMLFASTFQSFYYEHLMRNLARHFYEAMRIGERIKQHIKMKQLKVLPWILEQLQDMNQKTVSDGKP